MSKLETWRDIKGYEGYYQISDIGRVFSVRSGKILKPCKVRRGYLAVELNVNKQRAMKSVHRLVASAFIPNPSQKPQVNHINGVKTDNSIANLEWVTPKENINHAFRTGLKRAVKGGEHPLAVSLQMCDKKTKEPIRQFSSQHEATRWLRHNGFPKASQSVISEASLNKRKSAYGFAWKRKET